MSKSGAKPPIEIENSDVGILGFCIKILYGHENAALVRRLTERFGGVSGIFSASYEELILVEGVTERVASFFTVMRPLQRQAQLRAAKDIKLTSQRECAEYAAVYFMNEYEPFDACVCLDKNNKIICTERIGKDESIREVVTLVCKRNAKKIAVIRFDPQLKRKTVLPLPERQKQIIKIVKPIIALGVEFVDYVEYAQGLFFSLRRAVQGDIGVYRVSDAATEKYAPWNNAQSDLNAYYAGSVARVIEDSLKQNAE